MEPLSQLDVQNPDHVSVITRDGKLTVSVVKDGASVTLGFPIKAGFDTTPRPPLQQPEPKMMAVKAESDPGKTAGRPRINTMNKIKYQSKEELERAKEMGMRFKPKLTKSQVIEIKQILSDEKLMSQFSSKTNAYRQLGQIYGVSACRIAQIANGIGWTHVTV